MKKIHVIIIVVIVVAIGIWLYSVATKAAAPKYMHFDKSTAQYYWVKGDQPVTVYRADGEDQFEYNFGPCMFLGTQVNKDKEGRVYFLNAGIYKEELFVSEKDVTPDLRDTFIWQETLLNLNKCDTGRTLKDAITRCCRDFRLVNSQYLPYDAISKVIGGVEVLGLIGDNPTKQQIKIALLRYTLLYYKVELSISEAEKMQNIPVMDIVQSYKTQQKKQ